MKITVSPQAVQGFIKRHRAEIDAQGERLRQSVEDASISSKRARLADLQFLRDKTMAVIEERDGLLAEEIKIAANGDTVSVMRYDAGMVAQFRGVLADAAEEMGARTKITIDQSNKTFNYIELVGSLGE